MRGKDVKIMDTQTLLEQQEQESEKPPSIRPRPARPWRVAIIANVKGETSLPQDGPPDAGAEYDRIETIQSIRSAIEADGHITRFLPADSNLPDQVKKFFPDICFNIAEGMGGDSREAQVPALLEMLHVPYTASRVLANAVALDKTMTKRIWRDLGLPTASFQQFQVGDEPLSPHLHFPLFVKPACEGTGMGMDGSSIVEDEQQLRERVRWVIRTYRQPVLVEDYLPGREFTIGVLGRSNAAVYSPRPELYGPDGFHRFPVLEVDNSRSITPGVYGNLAKSLHQGDEGIPGFICPADVEPNLAEELQELAILGHLGINAVDVSRVDIRLDAQGRPHLLEINSLPGLSPGFSDLCVIAEAEGLTYQDLILEILYLGASRFGLLQLMDETSLQVRVPERVKVPFSFK
jgi:D-alanine-D-alanine ligase